MIGDIDPFTEIFGSVAPGDTASAMEVTRAALRHGLSILILKPGTKLPACTLGPADKKRADKEAREAAKAAGSKNFEHVMHDCGIKHALTDEKQLLKAHIKTLLKGNPNLAVALGNGASRMVVVDCDSAAQRDDFAVQLTTAGEWPEYTVTSPGTRDEQGNWLHEDAGHYWFTVPDDMDLPEHTGKYTSPAGWCVYFGNSYVLVPPSIREEGPYVLTGETRVVPDWLHTEIHEGAKDAPRKEVTHHETIDEWSIDTSWTELLSAQDYTEHAHDTCGCPTWTRPGSPAHHKSVTAHDVGCTRYDTSMGHGPLHIWSDALGVRTMSKMTFYAEHEHGGDMRAALRHVGIPADEVEPAPLFEYTPPERPANTAPKVSRSYQERMMRAMRR